MNYDRGHNVEYIITVTTNGRPNGSKWRISCSIRKVALDIRKWQSSATIKRCIKKWETCLKSTDFFVCGNLKLFEQASIIQVSVTFVKYLIHLAEPHGRPAIIIIFTRSYTSTFQYLAKQNKFFRVESLRDYGSGREDHRWLFFFKFFMYL